MNTLALPQISDKLRKHIIHHITAMMTLLRSFENLIARFFITRILKLHMRRHRSVHSVRYDCY